MVAVLVCVCTPSCSLQATAREAVNGAKDINDWIADATRGMIKDLIQSDKWVNVAALHGCIDGLWCLRQ